MIAATTNTFVRCCPDGGHAPTGRQSERGTRDSVPLGGNSEGVDVFAFIQNIGGPEVILILVVIMVIFGGSKLPGLARSLGASAKEFRKGVDEGAEVEFKD